MVINMFNAKVVKHKEFGLGILEEHKIIDNNMVSVYFSSCYKRVHLSELAETNIQVENCYKIDNKTFFNLLDVENYLNAKEYKKELNNLVAIRPTDGNAKTVIEFITKNSDELRKILSKYKDL